MTQPPINRNRGPAPATPRWVKLFVAILVILVLVVVAMHLAVFDFGGHLGHIR